LAGEANVFRRQTDFGELSLSNIPTYLMGFYHLTNGHHEELDNIRGRFFWQGGGGGGGSKTLKYNMAKWEDIATSKEFVEGWGL
jgi:hypothetical protein